MTPTEQHAEEVAAVLAIIAVADGANVAIARRLRRVLSAYYAEIPSPQEFEELVDDIDDVLADYGDVLLVPAQEALATLVTHYKWVYSGKLA